MTGRMLPNEANFGCLVEACGFSKWKARGEAEVDLCGMVKAGLLDVVLTDDGDTL